VGVLAADDFKFSYWLRTMVRSVDWFSRICLI
jgi:hypothetical protein